MTFGCFFLVKQKEVTPAAWNAAHAKRKRKKRDNITKSQKKSIRCHDNGIAKAEDLILAGSLVAIKWALLSGNNKTIPQFRKIVSRTNYSFMPNKLQFIRHETFSNTRAPFREVGYLFFVPPHSSPGGWGKKKERDSPSDINPAFAWTKNNV